ncbi:MAG: MMPL family transporter [Deltaproteobacteria bacterium]|nr:MMPL family transporter [Deltaproteobacteria bacterium]
MTPLETRIGQALRRWVTLTTRRPGTVAGLLGAVTLVLGVYAATHLGINTDYKLMMSEDVPFRRTWEDFARHFPTLDDSLLIVIDAQTPEQAREAADTLAARLDANREQFREVVVPGAGSFFERNGLLYRSPEELEGLVDRVAEVQPILAELTRDPSVSNLARIVRLGLEQEDSETRDWAAIFDRIGHATVAAYEEHPVRVSWEDVVLMGSALDPDPRRVIVAEPVLDYEKVFAAAEPVEAIRAAAVEEGLTPERGVSVRVTGNPALSYEEMSNLIWDVLVAGSFSIVFIAGLLYASLRSWRLVFASITNLVVGLIWTAAFAAVAVGRLNLVSIAFAVLFVGLGIDFAIHTAVHYEELRRRGLAHRDALGSSLEGVGAALTICTVTTAIGFFAFAPTQFRGVAELGLIAGVGMFVIFFLTVTLFPTLIELWVRGKDDWPREEGRSGLAVLGVAERRPVPTLGVALLLLAGCVWLVPQVSFQSNVVKMRDPGTESVQAFEDLLARAQTTPWQVDLLAPDLDAAQALSARLRELPEVDRAVTLADYIPADQEEKLAIIEDLAYMLDVPAGESSGERLPAEEQIAALRELHDFLGRREWLESSPSPFAASAVRLRDRLAEFLVRVESDPEQEAALKSLEEILLGGLPAQLERLRQATRPQPFGREDLPAEITRRMLAEDGSARVQVFPSANLSEPGSLEIFVDAVQRISPEATGLAAHIVEFSRATSSSLRQALSISLGLVTLLLLALWRRPLEVGLALAPLCLGAALTCSFMVLVGMPFNFSNVIVIPLLLGMGVDSGIHLVHRSLHRHAEDPPGGLAATHTARAVFYSALTTVTSFGSLAFSSHRGLSDLGVLLVVGMLLTLACNLLVLPALIRLYLRRRHP